MKRPFTPPPPPDGPSEPDDALLAVFAELRAEQRSVYRHRAGRAAVLAAAAHARATAVGGRTLRWRRRAAVAALGFAGANLALSGVVALAAGAQPDSILYGVKRAAEDAKLSLTFDPVDKAHLELEMADRRAAEAATMARSGHPDLALDAARDATSLVREAGQTLSAHPSPENEQALQHASAEARARLEAVFAALESGADPGASAAARSLDAAWSNGLGPDQNNAGGNPAAGSQGQGQGSPGSAGTAGGSSAGQGQGQSGGTGGSGGAPSGHGSGGGTGPGTHGHGGGGH